MRAAVAREAETRHGRAAVECAGKGSVVVVVVVEFDTPSAEPGSKLGRVGGEALKLGQAGAGVGIGEVHVEADHGRALAVEQLDGERRQSGRAPKANGRLARGTSRR